MVSQRNGQLDRRNRSRFRETAQVAASLEALDLAASASRVTIFVSLVGGHVLGRFHSRGTGRAMSTRRTAHRAALEQNGGRYFASVFAAGAIVTVVHVACGALFARRILKMIPMMVLRAVAGVRRARQA